MKKILILVALLLSVALFPQESIFYNSNPTLQWNATIEDAEGNPLDLLPEDTLSYEVYIFDEELGDIAAQPLSNLIYIGETENIEYTLAFPYRSNWACAIRPKITDGDNNISLGDLAYTVEPIPTTQNGPFVYAPILTYIPRKVEGLRDSGM